ncbi:MAG: LemA protein [Frankiaceae bacterium]|nr:LemA protein [Frankiaceae bacterium]
MIYIWLAVAVLVIAGVVVLFNSLVRRRNNTENTWAQIDVQLKRRYELIPNLVATVKGYAAHEAAVFENVTRARADAISAEGPVAQGAAENQLSQALRTVFAVAENYPQLKADTQYLELMRQLDTTESRIAYARQAYNDAVLHYDNAIDTVPSNLVASVFGFRRRDYFQIDELSRGPVRVDL